MIKVPPPAMLLTEVTMRPAGIGTPARDFQDAMVANEARQAAAAALPMVECTVANRSGVQETVIVQPEPAASPLPLPPAVTQPTIGDARLSAAAWRLTPSGTLGQATVQHTLVMDRQPVRQVTAGAVAIGSGQAAIAKPAAAPDSRPLAERAPVTGVTEGRAIRHMTGKHDPGATPPVAAEWAAALPLAQRLIRWTQREGHGATGWIRDYRLDDDAAARLVERVRAYVQERDPSLERIVINGRELWRKT